MGDTDLIYKSSDPRAMLLDDFIAWTLEKLSGATTEVVVDCIAAVPANPDRVSMR